MTEPGNRIHELLSAFSKPLSKSQSNAIASILVQQADLIGLCVELMQNARPSIVNRIAWTLNTVNQQEPTLIVPYLNQLIALLYAQPVWGACRSLLLIVAEHQLDEAHTLPLCDLCMQWIRSEKVPVAVRCNAMTMIYQIAYEVPELLEELRLLLFDLQPYGSAGFKSRSSSLLNQIEKLKEINQV
jgi:hypothetical protein